MDLTAATPVEIDTELYRIERAYGAAIYKAERLEKVLGKVPPVVAANYAADAKRLREEAARLEAEAAPLNAEHDRRGWERAFVVITSGKGHVHDTNGWNKPRCHSCNPTTRYEWLPELSGLSRTEIVGKIRSDACTHCYPGAPVGPRTVFSDSEKATQRTAADKAAAKAARAAKQAAAAITAPDGSVLRDDGDRIETERAARLAVNDAMSWAQNYRTGGYSDEPNADARALGWEHRAALLIHAIVTKHAARPAAEVLAEINKSVDARLKRDAREIAQYNARYGS